ncbi:trimethylsulfonium-tetrahydrofolate N-methyltransferase [Acididesulfobacillus acetoxydans]|uniref:Ribosomal RNA small subunit methyltransferase I n=1 Tax=Acididesulfobacillus acetoxydans TaxID=1561005 RepID=A0A8S0W6I1_9FIRM|nr:16S rRNA (cytidine(1402)-2'-O)-methyltransferase [Acididesulfobacillus acetoxydans]CAA7599869.1 trimethylsulfonium-tetrahydrofolate N-methyltransferase [Acididesulfobacillus acetoxydans]CEJ07435.1 Ribosomal RNA small subunit methyltransferase I [Acididesulfobacillus acetoxydans]
MPEKGKLFVCATPIGNLGDITLRVLDTLRAVDLIAAEDTRHSRKLLQHYEIETPLTSYHEHNEKGKARSLLARLRAGQQIALISDAGMPGISDPGAEIISLCYEEQIAVDVLPGANAALTGLVLSGLPAERFAFVGFLPAAAAERRRELEKFVRLPLTLVFYEAPHRLAESLTDMLAALGERQAAVVRELTKVYQTVHRGTLKSLAEDFSENPPRGECCVFVEPCTPEVRAGGPAEWRREVEARMALGLSPQEAMKEVAKDYGTSKREVYRAVLAGKR